MTSNNKLLELQEQWKTMYQTTLPSAARSKAPSQPLWPINLDHCFARIILDHTVGVTAPWNTKIKSPAYKNLSQGQLMAAIAMGERILDGELNLVELDNGSLEMRGKAKKDTSVKKSGGGEAAQRKRKRVEDPTLSDFSDQESRSKRQSLSKTSGKAPSSFVPAISKSSPPSTEELDLNPYLSKIALSQKTPFQKRVLSLICQVPRGKYTTYGLISAHLNSSARAVGNAMRNNPFAPMVPCHRILATGGGIGGFKGKIGRGGKEGENDEEKRALLREEGVRFDGRGRVVGGPWGAFK